MSFYIYIYISIPELISWSMTFLLLSTFYLLSNFSLIFRLKHYKNCFFFSPNNLIFDILFMKGVFPMINEFRVSPAYFWWQHRWRGVRTGRNSLSILRITRTLHPRVSKREQSTPGLRQDLPTVSLLSQVPISLDWSI